MEQKTTDPYIRYLNNSRYNTVVPVKMKKNGILVHYGKEWEQTLYSVDLVINNHDSLTIYWYYDVHVVN